MRAKKVFHFCFFSLFILAEDIAVACFILAFIIKFSENGMHVLYSTGLIFVLCWLVLIILVKVKWKIRIFGKHAFTLEKKTIYALLIAVFATFFTFVLANQVNSQLGPVALIQAIASLLFYSDVIYMRPLMDE